MVCIVVDIRFDANRFVVDKENNPSKLNFLRFNNFLSILGGSNGLLSMNSS